MKEPRYKIGDKVWVEARGNPSWRLIQGVFVDMPRGNYLYFLVVDPTRMPTKKKGHDKILQSHMLWTEKEIHSTKQDVINSLK